MSGWSAEAAAQARTVVTPSVSVGAAYDDNVLSEPDAQSDHVWRVTPGVTFTRDTATSAWLGSANVQGEWYSRFADLSTPAARQHADLTGRWMFSPQSSVDVASGYDNSITPGDLNLATGIVPGRLRAWRWFTGPEGRTAITTNTTLDLRYQITGDFAAITPDIFTHDAEGLVLHEVDGRDELRVRYIGQVFDFQGTGSILSNAGLLGWTRRVTPALTVRLDAGARYTSSRTRPEIDSAITRHTTFTEGALNYAWTQTTALGVAELVEVQRAYASWRYERPGHVSASAQGGLYRNKLSTGQADIYSGSVEVVMPLAGVVSLAAAYETDFQRGRVGSVFSVPSPGLPDLVVPPILLNQNVRRNLTLVRLIFSGSVRSASGPERPATDQSSPSGRPQ
jgi:hypothetical protein